MSVTRGNLLWNVCMAAMHLTLHLLTYIFAGSRENAGTQKRTLPDGRKTWRQVPKQGRELTWMVHAKGGLLVRMKACLYGTSWGQASGYTALILMLMGKNWGFPGKAISMFAPENMDCFSGDLVFPVILFVIQFFSVFPDYLLIILISHSIVLWWFVTTIVS